MKRKTKRSIKTLPAKKVSRGKAAKVRGGSLLTMKHEQLKAIAQNLRG